MPRRREARGSSRSRQRSIERLLRGRRKRVDVARLHSAGVDGRRRDSDGLHDGLDARDGVALDFLDVGAGGVGVGLGHADLLVVEVVDEVGGAHEGVPQEEVIVAGALDAELAGIGAVLEFDALFIREDEFAERNFDRGAVGAPESKIEGAGRAGEVAVDEVGIAGVCVGGGAHVLVYAVGKVVGDEHDGSAGVEGGKELGAVASECGGALGIGDREGTELDVEGVDIASFWGGEDWQADEVARIFFAINAAKKDGAAF